MQSRPFKRNARIRYHEKFNSIKQRYFSLKRRKTYRRKRGYHKIKTIGENPIYVKQFFIPYGDRAEIKKQTQEMLDQGIIEHSDSPYNFPIFLIPKREDLEGKTG